MHFQLKFFKLHFFLFVCIISFIQSSATERGFKVYEFNPISNFESKNDTLTQEMDLSDAIYNGISIPNQEGGSYFKFQFRITNNDIHPRSFYYRIFYQNESYKFAESRKSSKGNLYNELSGNNFYGSWEDSSDSFRLTPEINNDNKEVLITDSFRITGNPRNEKKYFGADVLNMVFTEDTINAKIAEIKDTPDWFNLVKNHAVKNNISLEEQLFRDAIWAMNEKSKKGNANNRWKRNPRVGNYSFILIVVTKEELDKLPASLKKISKPGGEKFINPYYDLLHNVKLLGNENAFIIKSDKVLKMFAKFDPGSGLYIDLLKFNNREIDTTYYSENCGSSNAIFQEGAI